MSSVRLMEVLDVTGFAMIGQVEFAVSLHEKSATLVGYDDESIVEFDDQEIEFTGDGVFRAIDRNGIGHVITAFKLVPVTMGDL